MSAINLHLYIEPLERSVFDIKLNQFFDKFLNWIKVVEKREFSLLRILIQFGPGKLLKTLKLPNIILFALQQGAVMQSNVLVRNKPDGILISY